MRNTDPILLIKNKIKLDLSMQLKNHIHAEMLGRESEWAFGLWQRQKTSFAPKSPAQKKLLELCLSFRSSP